MHMADALLSPAVGGAMWAATAAATVYSAKKVGRATDETKIPLMGVLGAFVFAAQMINFTIPATGSSGHLGGGLLLAILLGPYASFLTIASVLTVQALFFADGGLLALGSNIFNLGVFPCFIAYPLIFQKIAGTRLNRGRLTLGALLAAVVALQLGSLAVVVETTLSGVSELPFAAFLLLMQPIHLAIGLVEGLATAMVVSFIRQARPEILAMDTSENKAARKQSMKPVLVALVGATLVVGGLFSWFASERPDGLEWSIFRVSGDYELQESHNGVHRVLAELQEHTSLMPGYDFKKGPEGEAASTDGGGAWGSPNGGTSAAGLVGGALTMLATVLLGMVMKKKPASS